MRWAEERESPSTTIGAPIAGFGGAAFAPRSSTSSTAQRMIFSMNDDIGIAVGADKVSKAVDGPDGRLVILDDVSLVLARGDSLAIVGESGSGKTTLIGLLAGLDRPSSGAITLAGEQLERLDEEARARLRRRRVGFVFQNFHLLPA